jgi:hypothetical protein
MSQWKIFISVKNILRKKLQFVQCTIVHTYNGVIKLLSFFITLQIVVLNARTFLTIRRVLMMFYFLKKKYFLQNEVVEYYEEEAVKADIR